MPQLLFHRILVLFLSIPALITAADYYPLSVGSRWHYSYIMPDAPVVHHTYMIISDTIIGRQRYFTRQWTSSDSGSLIDWFYVSGNDVYKVVDLAQPDAAVKAAQKNFTAGDGWIDVSGLVGPVPLIVSFKGRDSVPAGVFDGTWSAYGVDADTLLGGLVVIRHSINHTYADGVGELGGTVVVLGTTHYVWLDSFYIAPEAGIHTLQRPRVSAENRRAHCLTVMKPAGDIDRDRYTDLLYSLNGKLLFSANSNRTLPRQRLPSGLLIVVPGKNNRSDMR